jgi:hypothetical protein
MSALRTRPAIAAGHLGVALALASAACYGPDPASGLPCSPTGGCPAGQACVDGVCGGGGEVPDADPLAPDGAPDAPPSNGNLVAFVTVTTVAGDFGGHATADPICQDEAATAGLPGDFVAVFNTTTTLGHTALSGSSGWVNARGDRLLAAASEWNTPALRNPIRYAADGTDLGRVMAWYGASQVETCGDWTSTAGAGGTMSSTEGFTVNFVTACANQRALICAERGALTPLPPAPAPPGKRVFVSTPRTPGGGLAGADTRCVTDATAAGLLGADGFRAALSVAGAGPFDRFATGEALVRPDGELVAEDSAALYDGIGALRSFPNRHADGTPYASDAPFVWIGAAGATCTDWTSTQPDAFADLAFPEATHRPFLLAPGYAGSCDSDLPVLCIEL